MFHEESLITSIFKLLNVTVLLGAGAYFFTTRVVQQIKEAVAQKKSEEKALHDEKSSLKAKLKHVEDEIIQQQRECDKVKHNMVSWQRRMQEQEEVLQQEAHTRVGHLEARIKNQSRYLADLKMQQNVLPKALADARKELEHQFTAERKHTYMQQIMNYMSNV